LVCISDIKVFNRYNIEIQNMDAKYRIANNYVLIFQSIDINQDPYHNEMIVK